jgi:hypothetical protein
VVERNHLILYALIEAGSLKHQRLSQEPYVFECRPERERNQRESAWTRRSEQAQQVESKGMCIGTFELRSLLFELRSPSVASAGITACAKVFRCVVEPAQIFQVPLVPSIRRSCASWTFRKCTTADLGFSLFLSG